MRICLFAFFAGLLFLAPYIHAEDVCRAAQTRSYMDIILDERNNVSEIFVYNLSKNYRKTGIGQALIYRADISNLSDPASISICYEVADDGSAWSRPGLAKFKYDPNAEGCLDHWFIFCPQYSGGGGAPTIANQQACLNGTSLRQSAGTRIDTPILRCAPAQNSLAPIAHPEYFPSHNELYICNQRPKDYAPLCWPLMLIFALLVGANYAMGKNPFQAFDLSAPRMNRGRQYTMRVQQKSFDAIGYLMALDKAVETTGKVIGTKTTVVTDAGGKVIGMADEKGIVHDTEGNVQGKLENGKFVAGQMVNGKFEKSADQPSNTNVIKQDAQWKGPTGLLIGLVGSALGGTLESVAGWLSKSDKEGGKVITDDKHNVIGEVNSKGQIVKDGQVIGAVVNGQAVMNDKNDTRIMSVQTIGKEVVDKSGNVIGRVYSDGKIRDEETGQLKGSYDDKTKVVTGTDGKVIEGATLRGMAIEIAGKGSVTDADKMDVGLENGKDQTQKNKYPQSVTPQSTGAIYTAPNILAICNIGSDKPWQIFSEEDKRDMAEGKIAAISWRHFKQNIGFDFGKDGWALSLLKMLSVMSTLSTYMRGVGAAFGFKGMSGGISFIENLNSAKLFSFPGSTVSFGTFASYLDPSYAGGAGLPYGMQALSPIFETAAQAGKAGISMTENMLRGRGAPEADYVAGYSGFGVNFIVAADNSYYAVDEKNGKTLAKEKLLKKLEQQDGTEKLLDLIRNGEGRDSMGNAVDANTASLSENMENSGLSQFWGKVGRDGQMAGISEDEFKSGLNAQLCYTETRNQTLGLLLRYADNPKLDSDDVKFNNKYSSEIIGKGKTSIGRMVGMLDNYGSLDEKGKSQFESALKDYEDSGLIGSYSLKDDRDRRTLMNDLKDVQKTAGKVEAAHEWNLVYIQASNSKRQISSLNDMIDNLDKGVAGIQREMGNYQAYLTAEVEARRAHGLFVDMGAGGALSTALQQLELNRQIEDKKNEMKEVEEKKGKDSEEYEKLRDEKGKLDAKALDFEKLKNEQQAEVDKLANLGKQGTSEYVHALVELHKLDKTQQIYDALKSGGTVDEAKLNQIDSEVRVICQNAYARASALDSAANIIYEAELKGLPREQMLKNLSSFNAAMGTMNMADGKSYGRLNELSAYLNYAPSMIGGIDDNAWKRMTPKEKQEITRKFERLQEVTLAYFDAFANQGEVDRKEKVGKKSEQLIAAETRLADAEADYQKAMQQETRPKSTTSYRKASGTGTFVDEDQVSKAEFELTKTKAEYTNAEKEYRNARISAIVPLKLAALMVYGEHLGLLFSIMGTRDYEGPNRDQNFMQDMKEKLSAAMLIASRWKGRELGDMSIEQKEALVNTADKMSWFANQMVTLEKGLHQTSNFFVNEMARGNLGQARFAGDFLGAGDQKFLEGTDPYKQSTILPGKMFPRMTDLFEKAAEYQYGDIKWNIPRLEGMDMPGKPEAPAQPAVAAAAMQFDKINVPKAAPIAPVMDVFPSFLPNTSRRTFGVGTIYDERQWTASITNTRTTDVEGKYGDYKITWAPAGSNEYQPKESAADKKKDEFKYDKEFQNMKFDGAFDLLERSTGTVVNNTLISNTLSWDDNSRSMNIVHNAENGLSDDQITMLKVFYRTHTTRDYMDSSMFSEKEEVTMQKLFNREFGIKLDKKTADLIQNEADPAKKASMMVSVLRNAADESAGVLTKGQDITFYDNIIGKEVHMTVKEAAWTKENIFKIIQEEGAGYDKPAGAQPLSVGNTSTDSEGDDKPEKKVMRKWDSDNL